MKYITKAVYDHRHGNWAWCVSVYPVYNYVISENPILSGNGPTYEKAKENLIEALYTAVVSVRLAESPK